ncbi:MAG: oligosaccharide flippase family protein [Candidatus Improbicoccus pseudotrichonymphae]|uniref:Oligosaccharide flippase family protein n=1 Tax=Candidatus Improbicoccus pseudotrichonymphae TaxID=3033792 RepID=A0AA48HYC3_9FIRM|nr:MAG: oligosaccharide flippase family protein [Candidatus Improbicoccus pseudotrichonymphae]
MRTKKIFVNVAVNFIGYFVFIVTTFFLRKKMHYMLGLEAMGLDAVFSNIVSVLSITELGIGYGMNYKLYKLIAEKKWNKIATLLNFIKKIYLIVSIVIFALGCISFLFILRRMDSGLPEVFIGKVFFLYIFDVTSSYLFFHRRIMFMVDQKNYLNNIVKIFVSILFFTLRMLSLGVLKSFEVYIILKIISNLLENTIIAFLFKKHYSHVNLKNASKFEKTERKEIAENIKSLFYHKIGGACAGRIPGLIAFLNIPLNVNGIYYSYCLIINAILGISGELFNGISASFGNFLNTETNDKIYENFKVLYFLNFLLYSFLSVAFFMIANTFMKLWMGGGVFLFSDFTVGIMTISLYICGMKQCVDMTKISAGIYSQDRFCPIFEALFNFVFSYFLSKNIGVTGIFLGNILSTLLIPFIFQPFFIYKLIFKKKLVNYYKEYVVYLFLTLLYFYLCNLLIFGLNMINLSLVFQIFLRFSVCFMLIFPINLILFMNSFEFRKIFILISGLFKKINKN